MDSGGGENGGSAPAPAPALVSEQAQAQAPQHPDTVNLSIRSPSPEVPNPLLFSSLPVATTVGQLKLRIKDEVPSNPEPQRQRLIHRGRLLSNDNDTILNVFGQRLVRSVSPFAVTQAHVASA